MSWAGRYNKASAAVVGGAIASVAIAFLPEMPLVVAGALDAIAVALLVWLVPNVDS